jgi:hypothetical protein
VSKLLYSDVCLCGGKILADMVAHMEKSDCHWVSYHTRQRILSAIALTVEALGIGDAIKNAMQKDPAPLILKVCINQTQKDMITIT